MVIDGPISRTLQFTFLLGLVDTVALQRGVWRLVPGDIEGDANPCNRNAISIHR